MMGLILQACLKQAHHPDEAHSEPLIWTGLFNSGSWHFELQIGQLLAYQDWIYYQLHSYDEFFARSPQNLTILAP